MMAASLSSSEGVVRLARAGGDIGEGGSIRAIVTRASLLRASSATNRGGVTAHRAAARVLGVVAEGERVASP
jgi:hypothetical protein